MALSDYNGFPGAHRDAVGRRMERFWRQHPERRPSECAVCYQTEGAIHGHNEDYSVEDVWLEVCITCHLMLHMRWREPRLWEDYKLAIRHGFQGPPLEQRNGLRALKQMYPAELHKDANYKWQFRSATVLDMLCPIKFDHPNAAKIREQMSVTEPADNVVPIRKDPFDIP